MKPISQLLTDWRAAHDRMKKLSNDIPKIIGVECVRAVKDNFRLQGYDDGKGVKPWEPRADVTNRSYTAGRKKGQQGSKKGSVYQATNPILLQTHNLYNSIKYKAGDKIVWIGVDLNVIVYAKKMNEGGPGTWGPNATNTPARKYMPDPDEGMNLKMERAVAKKLTFEYDRALKEFH